VFSAAITTAVSAYIYRKNLKRYTLESSGFMKETPSKEVLETWEDRLGCGKSYERVPNKQHKLWTNVRKSIPRVAHLGDATELDKAFQGNIRTLKISLGDGKVNSIRIFVIKGNYALINKHSLPVGVDAKYHIITGIDKDDVRQLREVRIDMRQTADVTHDVLLITIPSERFRDVTKHLMPHSSFDMSFSSASICGESVSVRWIRTAFMATNWDGSKTKIVNPFMYKYAKHFPGLCGTPLYVNTGSGSSFMGIHVAAGSENTCYAICIDKEMVDRACKLLRARATFTETASIEPPSFDLYPVTNKSLFHYEEMFGMDYYGHDGKSVMINNKSSLKRSKIAHRLPEIFDAFDFKQDVAYDKPIMKPCFRDGEYLNPYNLAARKLGLVSRTLDPEICRKTVDVISKHIIKGLHRRKVPPLVPLDVVTAINGSPDDAFLRRINASTSPGHGFTGSKADHIPLVDETTTREPTEELTKIVISKIERYISDTSEGFLFKCQLKDEPRTLEKIKKGKTRVFYMMSLPDLIISRMFLAPIYTLMVQHGDLFGTAVGINMHTEADKLLRDMLGFSPLFMEGDYSNYDQTLPPDVAHMAATIVYKIAEEFGYSPTALLVLRGVLSDNIYPILNMLGDVMSKCGNQPSGKYGTAEDNSLRGLVLLVYAFILLCPEYDFFECVKPVTYGDDVICSVKEVVKDLFNNLTYCRVVVEHYGMGYTSADKSTELVEFLTKDEISFLKRHFVKHPYMDIYIAPLDMNSMYKALEWFIPSSAVTIEDQMLSTATSILWESYFHSKDADTYNTFRSNLVTALAEEYGIEYCDIEIVLPYYEDIHASLWGEEDETLYTESSGFVERSDFDSWSNLRGELFSSVSLSPASQNKGKDMVYDLHLDASPSRSDSKRRSEHILDDVKGFPEREAQVGMAIDSHVLLLRQKAAAIESYLKEKPSSSDSLSLAILKRVPEARSYLGTDYDVDRIRLRSMLADIKSTVLFLNDISGKRTVRRIFTESGLMGEMHSGAVSSGMEQKIESMLDVSGEAVSYKSSGKVREPIDSGQYNILDVDDFFSRPVEITSFSIVPGTEVAQELKVWDLWSLNPAVRAKLRNYAYFSGNLHIKIAVSGTPFHMGRLLSVYCPYPVQNATLQEHLSALALQPDWKPLLMNFLSQQMGRVTINVNENKPVIMEAPFIAPKQMYNLYNNFNTLAISDVTSFNDFEDAGSLFIYSLNTVDSVSTSPSDVSVQVYAWAEDVKLGVPTGTLLAITTESGSMDERDTGPIENITSKVVSISKALESVPFLRPFAMASTLMFQGANAFASIFGWSYPVNVGEISRVRNQPLSNGANTIGFSTAKRITLDPKQELTVDPSVVAVDRDELLIRDIAAIETYLDTFTWSEIDTPLISDLFACRASPNLVTRYVGTGLNPTCHQPTPMAWVSQMFGFWRGTIKFRLEIVCSNFHRGKLAVVYEPNLRQSALIRADIDLNKQFVNIIDIQETQSYELCIDWASPRPWQEIGDDPTLNYQNFDSGNTAHRLANGFIYIVPFTALQSPDSSDVSVNVYVSCEDLRVQYPVETNFPTTRDILTESGDMEAIDAPVTCFTLNPTSAEEKGISTYYFGEEPLSLRALLKRFNISEQIDILPDANTTKLLTAQFNNFPAIYPSYGGGAATYVNLISHMRYAFLAMRGGLRKRVWPHFEHSFVPQAQCKVTLDAPSDVEITPSASIAVAAPSGASINGTVTFVYDTNGGVEFEVPFYSSNLFAFAPQSDLGGPPTTTFVPSLLRSYTVEEELVGASDSGYITEETATAEDFMFMRFIGVPFYSV
jgi:hypothetical protein